MSDLTPPSGEPEYLDSTGGSPVDPSIYAEPARKRRTGLIVGGAVALVAVAGAATWAAVSFLGSGADAAEALPGGTIAFASINLDPSGEQKIEALKTLKKFPGLADKLDFDTADDVRKHIFEEIQKAGECTSVDYAKDIQPWLGDRMAVAGVEAGEEHPSAVVVVEVTDEDAAKAGFEKLKTCDSGNDETGYVVADGWATLAETQAIADKVVADTAQGTLADDADYEKWTEEAGDSGIIRLYAAPEAGKAIADAFASQDFDSPLGGGELPDDVRAEIESFTGMAGVVRFEDGALELEFVGDQRAFNGTSLPTNEPGKLVGSLPGDTAAAIGIALPDGWLQKIADAMAPTMGSGQTGDDVLRQFSQMTGLDLPVDFETLVGDGLALSVGSDLDFDAIASSGDASGLDVGLKVKGDAAAAEEVLDKIRAQMGPQSSMLVSKSGDGVFVLGPNADYLDTLLEDGSLGDSATYRDVIPHGEDSQAVIYIDFDAGDGWLVKAVGDAGAPSEVTENVEPLDAFGVSVWAEGSISHSLVRLTTD